MHDQNRPLTHPIKSIHAALQAHIAGKKFEGGAKLQRRYTGGIAR